MFKASKGNGVQGDYALDDIIISQETCTQLDSLWKGDFTPCKNDPWIFIIEFDALHLLNISIRLKKY